MSTIQLEIIILASLTAVTCAILGVFLVLRRVSLMSDAISHSVLLGIVLAFFITKNLSSPLLIVGATLIGILTVCLTEIIIHTKKLKKDAAIGLVFPLLFSIGVILISKYTSDVHIDSDCVLFGEIAFTPFNRLYIGNIDFGPKGIWIMGSALILNISFVWLFYKELKLSTFDKSLAASLGFMPVVLHYALMGLVSITSVSSFESVGSILVVAFMIAPPASAYLLSNRLSHMIYISAGIGILSSIGGYYLAYILDTNIAGAMATVTGLIFLMVLVFAPEKGLLSKIFVRRWHKWDFAVATLSIHLLQAEIEKADYTEHIVSHMINHMKWSEEYTSEVIAQCIQEELIEKEGNRLSLTTYGREKANLFIVGS